MEKCTYQSKFNLIHPQIKSNKKGGQVTDIGLSAEVQKYRHLQREPLVWCRPWTVSPLDRVSIRYGTAVVRRQEIYTRSQF